MMIIIIMIMIMIQDKDYGNSWWIQLVLFYNEWLRTNLISTDYNVRYPIEVVYTTNWLNKIYYNSAIVILPCKKATNSANLNFNT